MAGTLYLCATPIGNLEDITFRVVRTLKEVDIIAAEDTRNSIKLLNHFDIQTPMTSYHEFNKYDKAEYLVREMLDGKNVAVITDAGTPGISDPGEEIARQAAAAGITVTSLPGPAACITALTISALPTRRFAFEAFLPSEKKERADVISDLKKETRTIIMYEAPHRLLKTLNELLAELGNRKISVCRELTKKHETALRTDIEGAIKHFTENEPKGEFVLVIEGRTFESFREEKQEEFKEMSIEEHMDMYLAKGLTKKEAMKQVATDRGMAKRDIYNYLEQNKD